MFKTDTWLRCSIEFDSLPVLSSSGIILCFALQSRCILTPTVTSILPFNPNLGDQMLSSISSDFVTSTLQDELLLLPSLGLKRNTACLIRAQLAPHMQQWLPHKYLFWLLGFCCCFFWTILLASQDRKAAPFFGKWLTDLNPATYTLRLYCRRIMVV